MHDLIAFLFECNPVSRSRLVRFLPIASPGFGFDRTYVGMERSSR